MKKTDLLISFVFTVFIVAAVSGCSKPEIDKWDANKTYTYKSTRESSWIYNYQELIVAGGSVPDGGVLTFDNLGIDKDVYFLFESFQTNQTKLDHLIPDFLMISEFVLVKGSFDKFNFKNKLTFEYHHNFRNYNYALGDYYQYYYHNDLAVYEISNDNDALTDLLNMDNWIERPVTFHDTLIDGNGILSTEIENVNAFYIIAVKY